MHPTTVGWSGVGKVATLLACGLLAGCDVLEPAGPHFSDHRTYTSTPFATREECDQWRQDGYGTFCSGVVSFRPDGSATLRFPASDPVFHGHYSVRGQRVFLEADQLDFNVVFLKSPDGDHLIRESTGSVWERQYLILTAADPSW